MPAVDLVAANDAYLRAFPGLEPGGVIHSRETGEWVNYHIQVFKCELPQRRWWIYSLVPVS